MIDLPLIPRQLLEALEKKYPEACPHPEDTDRTIWRNVGRREVIRYLRDQYNRQEKGSSFASPLFGQDW